MVEFKNHLTSWYYWDTFLNQLGNTHKIRCEQWMDLSSLIMIDQEDSKRERIEQAWALEYKESLITWELEGKNRIVKLMDRCVGSWWCISTSIYNKVEASPLITLMMAWITLLVYWIELESMWLNTYLNDFVSITHSFQSLIYHLLRHILWVYLSCGCWRILCYLCHLANMFDTCLFWYLRGKRKTLGKKQYQ